LAGLDGIRMLLRVRSDGRLDHRVQVRSALQRRICLVDEAAKSMAEQGVAPARVFSYVPAGDCEERLVKRRQTGTLMAEQR
jgi:hypothetical protein